MLIHLMEEQHRTLVSSEVTVDGDSNVIGLGPVFARASETFNLLDRFGHEIAASRGLKNGDRVTLRTAGGRYWRPTSSGTIGDNGTFSGNCQFLIARSGGGKGDRIRHGDTVALAVPPLVGTASWITIDPNGGLITGPTARSIPKSAARFTYFEANKATIATRDATEIQDLLSGSGRTIVVPVAAGQDFASFGFEVALDHEGLPPAGTRVDLDLSGSTEFHLREAQSGPELPFIDGHQSVTVPPGQARKQVFLVGPAHRPNPVLSFDNGFVLPPTCTLRVAATARNGFPGFDGYPGESDVGFFFPVAARTGLQFLIDRGPLFSLNGRHRDEVEAYGTRLLRSSWATGLTLTVRNAATIRLPRNREFEIVIITFVASPRDPQFPPDSGATLPNVQAVDPAVQTLPHGHFRFIGANRDGTFSLDFQMSGFFTQKPAMLGVDVALFQIERGNSSPTKIAEDQLGIEVSVF